MEPKARYRGNSMALTAYDIALIGGGFTVLGALIGASVTYCLALELARRNAKRDAGRRLREAFALELALMHPEHGKKDIKVEQILQDAFPKHSQAVIEFAFHLKDNEKKKFLKTWKEYYMVGGGVRFFDYYMGKDSRQLFTDRVNAILEFTEI